MTILKVYGNILLKSTSLAAVPVQLTADAVSRTEF